MYKKKILGLIFSFLVCGLVYADAVKLNPDHPDKYVVVKGDTLWDISGRFLQDAWQWPEIWHINSQIANPHLIYPGDTINLVYVDGKPRLVVSRGSKTVKLTPQGRIIPLDQAITTIPIDAIRQFLKEPQVVSKDVLDKAPYVVANKGGRLIAASLDSIYVRGIKDGTVRKYTIVRTGNVYKDPVTKKVLGYEALFIGNAKLYRTGDPSTLKVLRTSREIRIGDRLLPSNEKSFDANFIPRPPSGDINGQILAVLDGVTNIGSNQVIVINKGAREGLKPGNVLDVYQKGQTIPDRVTKDHNDTVTLPDEKAGTVMVFRVFDKISYALVVKARRDLRLLDYIRNP
ncbi:MAG TPA: LysM peptidoglycan-binding domain-containing protein [Gammaproteobacteria bacterium]|nr:LysM peptidoglycan-binding domain-containing protein [Gammaproteobacteria bacterium]